MRLLAKFASAAAFLSLIVLMLTAMLAAVGPASADVVADQSLISVSAPSTPDLDMIGCPGKGGSL